MQAKHLLIALTVLLISCNNSSTKQTDKEGMNNNEVNTANEANLTNGSTMANGEAGNEQANNGNGNWEKLVMVQYKDNNGALIAEAPYPANWKMMTRGQQGDPTITGPHNIKVNEFASHSFMYTNDPRLQQSYMQAGMQLRAMPGIDAVIKQDIEPQANQQGLQLIKYYEIPEVSKIDKWYTDQLYKAVPGKSEAVAIGTDWQTADGTPYFLLVHINVSTTANMQNWYYMSTGLLADKDYFEKAKKQLIFALANTHYALEPIMAYNQQEAQKAGQSWAAFNQRMAQNQANFEAQQREHINRTDAINNAIMSGYRERDAASDRQQERTIDGIYERENTVNTTTGQKYKVEGYHNQYWMNSNGEYISSDRNDYNPNLDDNMNNQKWEELKKTGYD